MPSMPSSLGSMKMEAMAKPRKTRAPRKVIFRIDMNLNIKSAKKIASKYCNVNMKTNNQGDKEIRRKEMNTRPGNESPGQNCPASTNGMAKTPTKDDTNLKSRAR